MSDTVDESNDELVRDWKKIDHWNVKVYDGETGRERETLRGVTLAVKDGILKAFDREGVQAQAMPYTADGEFVHGHSESVNWNSSRACSWCGVTTFNPPQSVEGYHSQMTLCDECEDLLDERGLLV